MATKIYLPSSGAAAVTPSTWNHAYQASTTYTIKGVLSKSSTAHTTRRTATGTTNPYTQAVMRYVIGPLSAVQISGTVNLVMQAYESNAGANATFSIAVKIIQPDGSDRSVLLAATASDLAGGVQEFTTTLGSRRAYDVSENRPITLTAQTPTSGDYLVIEIGFRSATGTTRNVDLRHGDTGANDLSDAEADTNDYCPWVDFSGTISWLQTLVVSECSHAHAPDAIALTQAHTLAISESNHAHAADAPVLTQVHVLANLSGDHAQTTDGIVLEQEAASTNLVVSECSHAHAADSPVLTQAHTLAVAEAAHGHAVDSPALTQAHVLVVGEAAHGHGAEEPVLTQNQILAIAEAGHSHLAEEPVLSQAHVLTVAETLHAQASEEPALTQAHVLAMDEASHGHTADEPTLIQAYVLALLDALHGHVVDPIILAQAHVLAVSGGGSAHAADNVVLQTETPGGVELTVSDCLHAMYSGEPGYFIYDAGRSVGFLVERSKREFDVRVIGER